MYRSLTYRNLEEMKGGETLNVFASRIISVSHMPRRPDGSELTMIESLAVHLTSSREADLCNQ